jgi:hypothetical protein
LERVSLTPALRVRGSKVDRLERPGLPRHRRREGADIARRDAVDGVGVVRDLDAIHAQLCPESYRPGTGDRRRGGQGPQPLRQLLGPADEGVPDPLAAGGVERREDLAPVAVEDREALALRPRLRDPAAERVEAADPARRQPQAGREAARGRDPDPQAGERAGAQADRDQVDLPPAAGRRRGGLDLAQQRRRVARPAGGGEPELGAVQDLAVAPGAGGGVGGRGVEADDDQREAPSTA